MADTRRPPADVLDAFGADGEPELLPGGTGRSWRAGSLVLEPLDHAGAVERQYLLCALV